MKYNLTLVRMAIIKKSDNKSWKGCGENRTLLYCLWEYKLIQPLWRTLWRFLKKSRNKTAIWPSNPTTGQSHYWVYPEETIIQRHIYPNVHCSTIYNSQDMEATQMSINRGMIKTLWYVYTHTHMMEYYSAIKKNEFESAVVRWMNLELLHKSEKQVSYINAYVWNLEKWYW